MLDFKKIGKRVQKKRIKHKMTQEQLAEALNLSSGYISEIETGRKQAGLIVLIKISEILSCSMDELLFGKLREKDPDLQEVSRILLESSDFDRIVIMKSIRALKQILLESRDPQ